MIEESLRTIPRYCDTKTGNLLLHPWVMLYTSGYVCPGAIFLTKRDIVPADITDNIASEAREALGTVARKPRAGGEPTR